MERNEAEDIVRRDLPGVIVAVLAAMPIQPPGEFVQQMYDGMFAGCVDGILDGTIRLSPDGRLTVKLLGRAGNIPNPREN